MITMRPLVVMKASTKPVPRPQKVVQYCTPENNLKNRIEGCTHRLRNPLCYTVVSYDYSTTGVLLCYNILLGANNHPLPMASEIINSL